MTFPRPAWSGMSLEEIEIPFRNIQNLTSARLDIVNEFIRIDYSDGTATLISIMFPGRKTFDRFKVTLFTAFRIQTTSPGK